MLERQRDILSPPPEKAKADHCPRCGAALRTRTDGSCDFCGAKIESGAFQWYVRSIALVDRQERGPLLTGGGVEAGTNRATILQPGLSDALASLRDGNRAFDFEAFRNRVIEIAIELQSAWTARDWERVRPLESEGLFQMHRYWIDAYRRQKLRNVVDDYEVVAVEPVKVSSDAFYESLTVRIWAHGRDYTIDESNRVVGGSNSAMREWTEYWTFIRTRAASGGTRKISCPNCGATVAAGATGVCEYCGGKLTAGTFDWVLSRIEQDESYRG
jgi:ribosomal protein L24E